MQKDTVILYYPQVDFEPYYPCSWAPLSILTVAAPLVKQGYRVILLDGNLHMPDNDVNTLRTNYDRCICVGISVMIGGRQIERALSYARLVKDIGNVPVVFGGPAASILSAEFEQHNCVDYVISGQGEGPFTCLVNRLVNESTINEDVFFVPKDDIPALPWHLLEVEKYIRSDRVLGDRVLNYASSQGCPYKCGYCSEVAIYHRRWNAESSDIVLSNVIKLIDDYNLDGIKFYDANFFVNHRRVVEFAQGLVDSGRSIKWAASAHPKGVLRLKDSLGLLRQAGLRRLLIGAESGSQEVLDYIQKGCTIEDNVRVAELCAEHGIDVAFTFIAGFPGIKEDVRETINMVLAMKKISGEFDIKIHFYAPFPGAPLFEQAVALGCVVPSTLEGWSNYDLYRIQTPWVEKHLEISVRSFGDFYCDFLYPPKWFIDYLSRLGWLQELIYITLKRVVAVRLKYDFHSFPLEMLWFRTITGKKFFSE